MSALLAVVLTAATVSGCSIQPDTSPREIPVGDRALLDPVAPEGGEASGSTRIFLIGAGSGGERQLRSVLRSVDASPTAVLQELFKGPNDQEEAAGLRTALPDGLTLNSARRAAGTLTVDVGSEILDLDARNLRLAVAEIVFTASELEGVNAVRLRADGVPRSWPDGRNEATSEPLTVFDFPGVAESAQPPFPPIPIANPTG